MTGEVLSPVELKDKVDELRELIAERMVALEEEKNWGTDDERDELAQALDELVVQGEALSDVLRDLA